MNRGKKKKKKEKNSQIVRHTRLSIMINEITKEVF